MPVSIINPPIITDHLGGRGLNAGLDRNVSIPMIIIRYPTSVIARTISVSEEMGVLELRPKVSNSLLIERIFHSFMVPSAPPVTNVEPHTGAKASAVTVVLCASHLYN